VASIEETEVRDVRALFRDHDRVLGALRRGVRRALWRHKQLGQSIVVWRDGRVVEIPANEIEVEAPEE
jgi:hypothetical protein